MGAHDTLYNLFEKTVVDSLRGNATLVTFAGASGNIYRRYGDEEVGVPSVVCNFTHFGPVLIDVDGIQETDVNFDCWHTEPLETADALQEVQSHFGQNETTGLDASLDANNIRTIGIRPLAPARVKQPFAGGEANIYVSTAVIKMRWHKYT